MSHKIDDLVESQLKNMNLAEFQPTYLYVKKHNVTGLKYFGKTTKDPIAYRGSGTYWHKHLEKYGDDVSTVWYHLFESVETLVPYAISFSIKNNIIDGVDQKGKKIWANLMIETGIGPGSHSEQTKEKIGNGNRGKFVSPLVGKKISEARKANLTNEKRLNYSRSKIGKLNPAWKGYIKTPDGIFESSKVAAIFYGCTDTTILNYCNKNPNWIRVFDVPDDQKIINSKTAFESTDQSLLVKKCSRSGWQGYIYTPKGVYINANVAGTHLDCNPSTIVRRCVSKNHKFKDWVRSKDLCPDIDVIKE